MTFIKICGITNPQDALMAAQCGADAIGLVFANSPRLVPPEQVEAILEAVPASIRRVGVFVNPSIDPMLFIVGKYSLQMAQLSGNESPRIFTYFPRTLKKIKAIHLQNAQDLEKLKQYEVDYFLLDTRVPGKQGGTGQVFDWDLAVQAKTLTHTPILLAGGLTPENVRDAIQKVRPFGVDVSSGVERAPGQKDEAKIKAFVLAVNEAL